jgi:selenide,water dikinase
MKSSPVFKDLVFIGGGHSHALALRQWAMKPLPGVRITLISPQIMTPYSGMLPGLLAGHYHFEQTHIDLQKLALWADVRYIQDQAIDIDPVSNIIHLQNHPPVAFDVCSIDIGSTPNQTIPGAAAFTTPVKPINHFYHRWQQIQQHARQQQIRSIAVVGGGAGSVEVILAMAYKLDLSVGHPVSFHLLTSADKVLANYHPVVRKRVNRQLKQYGIHVHTGFKVNRVSKNTLHGSNQQSLHADEIIWCTQARGAEWLKSTALDCDDSGFIAIRPTLQSRSFDHVFAAGDIATLLDNPHPKAGVYAVRQAPVLFHNLRAQLLKQPLKHYRPQSDFLSLLALGEKTAAGSKFFFGFYGDWVWRWKDSIDRKFMAQFHQLPERQMPADLSVADTLIEPEEKDAQHQPEKRCHGCGGKIGAPLLQNAITAMDNQKGYAPKDAVAINSEGQVIYQSVDWIKSPVSDPWLFGRIVVNHALSDLYAMNIKPDSAQVILSLPYAGEKIQQRELSGLLQGISEQLKQQHCRLLGGHSAEAQEMSAGLTVNGLPQSPLFHKAGLQAGDKLVLSKPLGIGIILAAAMQNRVDGESYAQAIDIMLQSNQEAATLLAKLGVKACTDVTGFGLYGHLLEMCQASACRAHVFLDKLPLIASVKQLAEQKTHSSLFSQNVKMAGQAVRTADMIANPLLAVMFDPQTSGGLLAGIPQNHYPSQHDTFHQQFFTIGEVLPATKNPPDPLIEIIDSRSSC